MALSSERKRLVGIIAVVAVAVAAVAWWQWSRWTGMDRIDLDTPEAAAFLEELRSEQGVQKASMSYGLSAADTSSIEIEISVTGLERTDIDALADEVATLMRDAAFQASFVDRYNARYPDYPTERPDYAQVVIKDTGAAEYTFYRFSLNAPDYEPVLTGSSE